ncbi:hypothetical protein AG1IA_08692 [Rhizoctonia solani AG-1 IA]|uniref:Uncharacterized protein n=1 Tax=Thanatephorus cucumeris (strain AG1-IA) TaxID=983506 RepID=L8WKG5_THACA|nr:hypothetical protein AG1IA_08692 [Rhizoctonia solani AG-1 IA]
MRLHFIPSFSLSTGTVLDFFTALGPKNPSSKPGSKYWSLVVSLCLASQTKRLVWTVPFELGSASPVGARTAILELCIENKDQRTGSIAAMVSWRFVSAFQPLIPRLASITVPRAKSLNGLYDWVLTILSGALSYSKAVSWRRKTTPGLGC